VSTGGAKSLSEKSGHAIGDDALALQSQVLMTCPTRGIAPRAGMSGRPPTVFRRDTARGNHRASCTSVHDARTPVST